MNVLHRPVEIATQSGHQPDKENPATDGRGFCYVSASILRPAFFRIGWSVMVGERVDCVIVGAGVGLVLTKAPTL